MMKNLEASEDWFLRRMLRILWTDEVSTCEVYRRAGIGKGRMQDMIRRQITFLGHVEGTRDRGKQSDILDVSQQTQRYTT